MPVDDSYTKVLLHMDGADNSTTFTDESGKTWTTVAPSPVIDTAQSVFGGSAGYFSQSTDCHIRTPAVAEFNAGTGDFTVDFRMRLNAAIGSLYRICGLAGSWRCQVETNGKITAGFYRGGTVYNVASNAGISTATWYHVAMEKISGVCKLAISGIFQTASQDFGAVAIDNGANYMTIGKIYAEVWRYNGWVDEFRYSVGTARWTSDFTPPTAAYTPSNIKKINGVEYASIKTASGLSIASAKTISGVG